MFSFHVNPDLDISFQKLIEQIIARRCLGTLLRFKAPGDLWVNIVEMQELTSVNLSEAGPLRMAQRWSTVN